MSTHASIIIQTETGYRSVYLHSDGYPEHAFNMLLDNYTERGKVEALINLGDLSFLDKSIDRPEGHSFRNRVDGHTLAYGRDRGEPNCEPGFTDRLNDHTGNQYNYLFTLDNKWKRV